MNTSVLALRAITSVTFRKMLKPASWIVLAILVILYLVVFYLTFSYSAWWLLTLIVLLPLTLIAASLLAALWHLSRRLMPRRLLPSETATVSDVVDKIQRLLEARATPVPIIMFMIAKDIVRGKGSSYIDSLVNDSKGLKDDFASVKSMFEKKELS